jgi:hypothetical protein
MQKTKGETPAKTLTRGRTLRPGRARSGETLPALRSELRRAGIPAFSPEEKENRSPVCRLVVSRSWRQFALAEFQPAA